MHCDLWEHQCPRPPSVSSLTSTAALPQGGKSSVTHVCERVWNFISVTIPFKLFPNFPTKYFMIKYTPLWFTIKNLFVCSCVEVTLQWKCFHRSQLPVLNNMIFPNSSPTYETNTDKHSVPHRSHDIRSYCEQNASELLCRSRPRCGSSSVRSVSEQLLCFRTVSTALPPLHSFSWESRIWVNTNPAELVIGSG